MAKTMFYVYDTTRLPLYSRAEAVFAEAADAREWAEQKLGDGAHVTTMYLHGAPRCSCGGAQGRRRSKK